MSLQIEIMKRCLLLGVLFLLALVAKATHIVGGEFEMVHAGIDATGRFKYNFGLILYFDLNNGAMEIIEGPNAERLITVRIFSKRTNAVMGTFILKYVFPSNGGIYEQVKYFQEECSEASSKVMKTARLYYKYAEYIGTNGDLTDEGNYTYRDLVLNPEVYDDPEGYYIAWERCCRNYTIKNIYSDDPDRGPRYAGLTFYLEFPPLKKNGELFINSSPTLFPPLSDYACPNRLYYVDFAGTDLDEDSLVYTMVEPYNTHDRAAVPLGNVPGPGPYPYVQWQSPFSMDNIMMGAPDLNISSDGLLTVVPTLNGLYSFAVKCEEFRNGEKIGEIRRDFQMYVLDNCPIAEAPLVEAKPIGGDFQIGAVNVSFPNTTVDNSRCVIIRVSDPSSTNIENGNQDEVKIRAVPLGFKNKEVKDIIPEISEATLVNGSTAEFTVCFPKCPFILGPYKIGIIAEDNSCPLPLLDTVVVTVNVELPRNAEPYFQEKEIIQTVQEGSGVVSWNIIGKDENTDPLILTPVPPIGFSLTDYGFNYTQPAIANGLIETQLTWNSKCDEVDFSQRTNFPFMFLLNDLDECDLLPPDTMRFDLTMDLYDFHLPVIEYVPEPALEEVNLVTKIYESVNFNVHGSDGDANEVIVLAGNGINFTLNNIGASFPGITGKSEITSLFSWRPDCEQVELGDYAFQFILTNDDNRCNYHLADTLLVNIEVLKPDNVSPILTADGVADNLSIDYTLGEAISIPLAGTDNDANPLDLLTLSLLTLW